jgi:hypothetical protein
MATTAGDIYVRSGASGSFTEITYVQGGWVTVASSSTMYSLYHDRLKSGQIVYVQNQNQLYVTSKFVAFETPGYAGVDDSASFATFQFPSSGSASVPSGTISSSAQIAAFGYLTSASAVAAGFGSGGGGSTDISSLNTFTASAQTSLTSLNSATSSYALKTNVSGAFTSVSSSLSTRLTTLEGTSGGDVTALNLFTGSAQSNLNALNTATSSFILVSQTSSMSVLSALTASFIGNLNYNFITNLPNLISSSAQIALLGAGLLSSSAQIANQISGSFTSLSASFAARLDSLNVGGGIFQLTGSSYNTTNNIQITGSLSVGSGSFKSFEVNSDGFVVLGDMNKDLNTAPIGTVVYSGSSFYLIS